MKRYNKTTIIIITLLVFLFSVLTTYSIYTWSSSSNTNVSFQLEGIDITYNGGENITANLIPTANKDVAGNIKKEITISSDIESTRFNLYLNIDILPTGLKEQAFKWEIYKDNTLIKSGNFANYNVGEIITLLSKKPITPTTDTYYLYIWVDGANYNNLETIDNQTFNFTLKATADNEDLLPVEYTELEYLESTGTQYIDTGYIMTSNTERVYLDFVKTNVLSNTSLFGSEHPTVGTTRTFTLIPHGTTSSAIYCGSGGNSYVETNKGRRYRLDLTATNNTIMGTYDDVYTEIRSFPNFSYTFPVDSLGEQKGFTTIPYSIFLFANHTNGGSIASYQLTKAKIYRFKLWDNDVLVRDYVPARRNSDQVLGMYDKVYNNFYTNAGTGVFLAE